MTVDKKILLDTNVLLRAKQASSRENPLVIQKLIHLAQEENVFCICPQNIYEFYVVATRPIKNNGLGLSKTDIQTEIQNLLETYEFLEENAQVFIYWQQLIDSFEVKGKTGHDARLVATMLSHNLKRLYTLNIEDFQRYTSIIELI